MNQDIIGQTVFIEVEVMLDTINLDTIDNKSMRKQKLTKSIN
jgi:hypothetical protein